MIEKVKVGDTVKIRASTWNGFVDAANYVETAMKSGGMPLKNGLEPGIVRIKNTHMENLAQFSGVRLTDLLIKPTPLLEEFRSIPPVFTADVATSGNRSKPFAILIEPVAAGKIGRAVLYGMTVAQVDFLNRSHSYVQPTEEGDGTLESCETGTAKILWRPYKTGLQWCVVWLGSGAAQEDEPHGMFTLKLVSVAGENGGESVTKIRVYNSRSPDSQYAGGYTANGAMEVPVTELPFTDGVYNCVYLHCSNPDTATFSLAVTPQFWPPSDAIAAIKIGDIDATTESMGITQWLDGRSINIADYFFYGY